MFQIPFVIFRESFFSLLIVEIYIRSVFLPLPRFKIFSFKSLYKFIFYTIVVHLRFIKLGGVCVLPQGQSQIAMVEEKEKARPHSSEMELSAFTRGQDPR